jgi:hypothetical protein
MGLSERLFRASRPRRKESEDAPSEATTVRIVVSTADAASSQVKVTGTTTHGADAVAGLARRRQISGRGMLQGDATLQRESDNPVDQHAVAVHVEGGRIGYLPSYLAKELQLGAGTSAVVPIQMFFVEQPGGMHGEAWVWLGGGPEAWEFSASNPPPLTTTEKRAHDHGRRRQMVADAVVGGGDRAKQFQVGMVEGVHYLELVEPIKQLKRDGRLQDALHLSYRAIEGAEADRQGGMPAPWYFEQAAILHRKLGDLQGEIDVLERWLRYAPAGQKRTGKLAERLEKLRG